MRERRLRHFTPRGVFDGDPEEADEAFTALGRARRVLAELQENRRALAVFTTSRFRATYRAQSLGILWPIANPLILMIVMSVVFGVVFKPDVDAYPVFLMLGLVLWHFLTHAWTHGTTAFIRHADIVKKTGIPPYVVSLGTVLSHLFTLAFASLSVLPLIAVYPEAFPVTPALLLLPVLVVLALVGATGLVLATSVLHVLYRDVAYIVDSALLVLFWATPIVWPIEQVPEWVHPYLWVNPIASNLHCIRSVVMHGALPPAGVFGAAVVGALALLVFGVVVHRRYARLVVDHV